MSNRYGRFTVRGSAAVEEVLTSLVNEAAEAARAVLKPAEYRALVMMGGYGRGEGGVEIVDGQERPHNNVDFLLIAETARPAHLRVLRQRLLEAFAPVMQKYDIEIDLSVVSVWKLRLSPSLIIWYDTRFGHKTILGDAKYVPSRTQFRLSRIPSRDALRLLVNRGTLLVINEHLLEQEPYDNGHRRRITRNIMKAIIGYGDALLFFLGDYHWSYVERKRRMEQRTDVDEGFRALYDEAAEFRFKPDYARYQSRDLKAWLSELRATLEPLHRFCEEKRLGAQDLTWEQYPAVALGHALSDEPYSARAWVRKAAHLARSTDGPDDVDLNSRLGYRVLGDRGRYPLIFPVIAYDLQDPRFRQLAATCLKTQNLNTDALRAAYLRAWCGEVDINAQSTLRKWHIPVSSGSEG